MDIPSVENDLATLATWRLKLEVINRKPAIVLWKIVNEGLKIRLSGHFLNHALFAVASLKSTYFAF